ncbi:hypothetical protein HMPREF1986_00314 [Oribacterium sp. oral taxon 078 str. F0263]|nr:hypothetical protein HMPREF1986_00314 [Oribacterium sp. oral taxon 078 str. F0263]
MPFCRSDRKGFYLAAYTRIGLRDGGMESPGKRKYFFTKKTPGKIPRRPSSERETGIEPGKKMVKTHCYKPIFENRDRIRDKISF